MWVLATYTGQRAKSVQAHAEAGIGYFLIDVTGNRNNPEVTVAMQYDDNPLPEHMMEIRDQQKIREFERKRLTRIGFNESLIHQRLGTPPKNSFGGFEK
jgi:hypothetical protein